MILEVKTTNIWKLASRFIVFGYVSIILSSSLFSQNAQQTVAVVITETLSVTQGPSAEAVVILKLRKGDAVDVLGKENGFFKIRYKLEGDFPIEGYAPEGALAGARPEDLQKFSKEGQSYKPETPPRSLSEAPPVMPSLPTEITKPQISPQKGEAVRATSLDREVVHKRDPGPWLFEGRASMGYSLMKESLKTKAVDTAGTPYGDPFLQYEMPGLRFGLEGRVLREMGDYEVGVLTQYAMTLFRGVVANATSNFDPKIDSANVQATRHEFALGPLVAFKYSFHPQWHLRSEVRILPYLVIHTVNQLKSQDNMNPGVTGQSVLYSQNVFGALAEFSPSVSMPHHFRLTPLVGATLYSSFTESPIQTSLNGEALSEAETRRTGKPKTGSFVFHYGVELAFNLKPLGWETINMAAAYRVTDLSHQFSGQGNRAGLKTLDVQATSSLTTYSFGVEYLF